MHITHENSGTGREKPEERGSALSIFSHPNPNELRAHERRLMRRCFREVMPALLWEALVERVAAPEASSSVPHHENTTSAHLVVAQRPPALQTRVRLICPHRWMNEAQLPDPIILVEPPHRDSDGDAHFRESINQGGGVGGGSVPSISGL